LQKAEYFVAWDLNRVPQDRRNLIERLYKTKLHLIRAEIAFHAGDIATAFEWVTKLREVFMTLGPPLQRLLTSHCYVRT